MRRLLFFLTLLISVEAMTYGVLATETVSNAVLSAEVQTDRFIASNLSCEQVTNPLGIDTKNPLLSWIIEASMNDIRQSAYEIIVSNDKAKIDKNTGDIWNTGKVSSDVTVFVTYEGEPLKAFTRYYWKVKVYNQNGTASEWSPVAWFETAMLDALDWKASWIGDGSKQFTRDEDFYQDDPMPLFRKTISVGKNIKTARLYICGLGYYEAFINGEKVGNNVLDPGWTAHKAQALYVVHDITGMLKKGQNVAGVMLGNGWYNPLPMRLFRRFNLRDHQQTGRPVLKAQLLINYTDGSSEVVCTDDTWKTAPGPVIRNNVYLGEHYDARAEIKNWNKAGINESGWKNAVISEGPSGQLTVQMQPPVVVGEVVKAVRIYEHEPGVYIVDMGINFAGVARIKVKGPKGTKVNIRYGENIHPDGSLNWYTTTAGHIKSMWNLTGGPGAPADAYQECSYILKGEGTEVYTPRFTFHGFRYIEITGWPGKPDVSNFEGLRMYADLQTNGEFECSNDMFNKLHEVTLRTFLSNVFSVQSDCPGREKMGYGGDIVATSESFIYNFDMGNFYRKVVRDFINDQIPEGGMTEIAPYTGIADRGLGGESGPLGWQLAFPYLQKQLYDFYGDKRIIENSYPAFVKQMEFINSKTLQGLFHWEIGDHIALDPRAEAFSASTFYYEHARLITQFAKILGKTEDAKKYEALCQRIKNDIVRKYFIPNTGRFDNATQAAQAFALYYNLSPDPKASLNVLMSEYERHLWHVSTGIFACKMAFDVLRQTNNNEVAYRVANQREYPGWGHMLAEGATTLWESWEYPDNGSSQNHPMFGSTEEWFYRSLLGINAAKPGFKEIIIKPQPAGDLKWAKGSYKSVSGTIMSDWKIEGDTYSLSVEIPANTKALVYVQTANPGKVKADPIAVYVEYLDGYAIYEVPSGKYVFQADDRSQRASLKPEISGDYVYIYEPQEDVFQGPDTENLVAGKKYPSWQPNDHCFIKDQSGTWHAFGITHPTSNPGEQLHQGEYSLFHITPSNTSRGLFAPNSWRDQPKVLNPNERPRENLFIFAPDIIKKDAQYVMIYGPAPLRMASSRDLLKWTPKGPLGVATNSSDRDPNFMFHDGVYYLTYCAGNSIQTSTSTNLRDWSAPVEIFRPEKESYQCESPILLHNEGMFYLFWCVWDSGDRNGNAYDERTFVYSSDNPLNFKGKPLLTELKAHAPEIIRDDNGQWYISSTEYPKRGLSVAKLKWK